MTVPLPSIMRMLFLCSVSVYNSPLKQGSEFTSRRKTDGWLFYTEDGRNLMNWPRKGKDTFTVRCMSAINIFDAKHPTCMAGLFMDRPRAIHKFCSYRFEKTQPIVDKTGHWKWTASRMQILQLFNVSRICQDSEQGALILAWTSCVDVLSLLQTLQSNLSITTMHGQAKMVTIQVVVIYRVGNFSTIWSQAWHMQNVVHTLKLISTILYTCKKIWITSSQGRNGCLKHLLSILLVSCEMWN